MYEIAANWFRRLASLSKLRHQLQSVEWFCGICNRRGGESWKVDYDAAATSASRKPWLVFPLAELDGGLSKGV